MYKILDFPLKSGRVSAVISGCSETLKEKERQYDLSVITVCRNAEVGLQKTLSSVLWHKKHGNLRIEHVVVDGNSTDGSAELAARAFQDGDIERFVSEPDSGIYDAMNKGGRMARGRVIYFLNCGDELLQLDLEDFLRPLLEERCMSLVAPVRVYKDGIETLRMPTYDGVFLITPACHQGYFVKAELFDQVGGFDLTYRCIADADFMCKVMRMYGDPVQDSRVVASRVEDGFSRDCGYVFLPEYIALRTCFLDDIIERSRKDADFMYYAIVQISDSVVQLTKWYAEFNRDCQESVRYLQIQCRTLRGLVPEFSCKLALWWYEKVFLAHMRRKRTVSETLFRSIKYAWAASLPPAGCRYVRHGQIQGAHFRQLVKTRLMNCFKWGKK